jgi:sec-independent protein translocase protein TatB
MFDIGFSELMVIAVVALVVIGPERLPRVARTAGHLFGRLQRYVNDVKADINREIELEELRKFKTEFEQAAQSVESDLKAEVAKAESSLESLAEEASLKPEIERTDAELKALIEHSSGDPHSGAGPAPSDPAAAPVESTKPGA